MSIGDGYEWEDWRTHDGGHCPVDGQLVHAVLDAGSPSEFVEIAVCNVYWHHDSPRFQNAYGKVIRFRVRKSKGMEMIREALKTVEDPEVREKIRELEEVQ